jgi:hypothetical protein
MKQAFVLLALALLASGSGCRYCSRGYDYCGPVYDHGQILSPGFCDRRASILGPGSPPATNSVDAAMPDPEPTVAPVEETPRMPPSPGV